MAGCGDTNVTSDGATSMSENIKAVIDSMPTEELNDAEYEALALLREEEKLARDVYNTLYDQYNQKIFNNITQAEQTHFTAVKYLLDKYEVEDNASDTAGVFNNATLASLYTTLLSQASSLTQALKVGATIEDVDIYDIDEALEEIDNEDITYVFELLQKGSRNHLRAFVRNIERQGESYSPQYISQELYDSIISSSMERGN
jgi:hypothetical protein